jgi:hypothetical protein
LPDEKKILKILNGNQNPLIEEGEITQWQKEKEQKNKQREVHPLNVWSNSNIYINRQNQSATGKL